MPWLHVERLLADVLEVVLQMLGLCHQCRSCCNSYMVFCKHGIPTASLQMNKHEWSYQLSRIYDNLFAPNLSGERRLDFSRSWYVNINLNKSCFYVFNYIRGWVNLGQNLLVFPWSRPMMYGPAESEHTRLTNGEIISEEFQPMWSESTNVTDGQMDGQTKRRHAIARPRFTLKCIAR